MGATPDHMVRRGACCNLPSYHPKNNEQSVFVEPKGSKIGARWRINGERLRFSELYVTIQTQNLFYQIREENKKADDKGKGESAQ